MYLLCLYFFSQLDCKILKNGLCLLLLFVNTIVRVSILCLTHTYDKYLLHKKVTTIIILLDLPYCFIHYIYLKIWMLLFNILALLLTDLLLRDICYLSFFLSTSVKFLMTFKKAEVRHQDGDEAMKD